MANQVNDRGAKKWTRLTIPEFKESLIDIYQHKEDKKSIEEKAEMKKLIVLANSNNAKVGVNYISEDTIYEINGYIIKWYPKQEIIELIDDYGETKELKFCFIEGLKIIY
ncbi:MAG: YolD-like family protein [Syntrophomonadaceae bacterium]|nr:YolD-like family protein [Syntrophomonadaceae bacterium]